MGTYKESLAVPVNSDTLVLEMTALELLKILTAYN